MGLGWDAETRAVVIELLAVSEAEVDEAVVLDDTEEGPDAVRVFLTPPAPRRSPTAPTGWSAPAANPARCAANPSTPTATSAPGRTATAETTRARAWCTRVTRKRSN
ncbi:hypothetical protein GCM10029964_058100 [Kibdelosporangium lantanae]